MNQQKTRSLIPYLSAWIISLFFAILIFFAVVGYGSNYDSKIIIISFLYFLFWTFLLILNKKNSDLYSKTEFIVIIVAFIILAFYLANTVWNNGYLTLNPIGVLANGKTHRDTLYHVTLTQSITQNWYPSFLMNTDSYASYHFASHLFMALLSKLTRIPPFYVYNYLYSILLLPLYIFLIFSLVIKFRKYLNVTSKITITDIILVLIFVIGFFPTKVMDRLALWNSSWIISETFLFSNIILLFFGILFFYLVEKNYFSDKIKTNIFLMIIIPVFILVLSMSKISTGFLFCASVMYYFFRYKTKNIKYWCLNFFYLVLFLLIYITFSKYTESSLSNERFVFLHFVRVYVGEKQLFLLHYLFLLSFSLLFLVYRIRSEHITMKSCIKQIHIYEEILLLTCLFGILPGLFLPIGGGSAAYFSFPQQLLAIILLISFDIPNKIIHSFVIHKFKSIIGVVVVFLLTVLLGNALNNNIIKSIINFRITQSITFVKSDTKKNIIKYINNKEYIIAINKFTDVFFAKNKYFSDSFIMNINEINSLVKNNQNNYYLYIDNDAEIWDKFTNYFLQRQLVYPALTGLVVINTFYSDKLNVYNSRDELVGAVSLLSGIVNNISDTKKLLCIDAIEKTKKDGKAGLIILSKNTYKMIDCRV